MGYNLRDLFKAKKKLEFFGVPIQVYCWWHKLVFPFLKTYVSVDMGHGHSSAVYFKKFRGVIYVVKMEGKDEPEEEALTKSEKEDLKYIRKIGVMDRSTLNKTLRKIKEQHD